MSSEINILKPEDVKQKLISFFKNNSLVPIVGSGFTCGLSAFDGIVPNGDKYKRHMITKLLAEDFQNKKKKKLHQPIFQRYVIIMKMMIIYPLKFVAII